MTNFRPKSDNVKEDFEVLQEELKQLTSHRKTSANQTLNYAVRLAAQKLEEDKKEIQETKDEAVEKQKRADKLEKQLVELADF